jgi:hypothetical protein
MTTVITYYTVKQSHMTTVITYHTVKQSPMTTVITVITVVMGDFDCILGNNCSHR